MSRHKKKHGKPYEVRDSDIHGHGVFAAHKIKGGERIVRYKGERIDIDEAIARYDDDSMEQHHTFLFGLADGSFIDGGSKGNAARFINHSCEPNCEAREKHGKVQVYALRDIPRGEELTYDYSLEREGDPEAHWAKLYECRCGAKSCRGTILRVD
jgi:SET domain-containing protein